MKEIPVADFARQIAEQREHIADLKREQEAIFKQHRSRAEVAAIMDRHFSELVLRGHGMIAQSLQMLASGATSTPTVLSGVAGADGVARIDVGPLLAAAVGIEQMRDLYLAELECVPLGLSREARKERLQEISYELETGEVIEEYLIEQSEEAGTPVARRPDARASVVLAPRDGR